MIRCSSRFLSRLNRGGPLVRWNREVPAPWSCKVYSRSDERCTASSLVERETRDFDDRIVDVVGIENVIERSEVQPPPWDTRQPFRGRYLLTPRSVEQVSNVLALCNEWEQPVVPIGGITGLVQGCSTRPDIDIGLSLAKLDAIEEVDSEQGTLTVQAGVTLGRAQLAAKDAGWLFPVDIGSRDTCMLGGNVSTNAGGTRVLRSGMTKQSVLGLEAVMADGTIISSMNSYLKNNSGYDLKQLFMGSEGTLGIVTRLVFRLEPEPTTHNVALLAASKYSDVVAILKSLRGDLGPALSAFEVMWKSFYDKATQPLGRIVSPMSTDYPFYVLVESMGYANDESLDLSAFEFALGKLFEADVAADCVLAKSDRERSELWSIRHQVEWIVQESQSFDVSLRMQDADSYAEEVIRKIYGDFPNAYAAAYGHLGDNNLHISVLDADPDVTAEHVYRTLEPYRGAISAEHGIGLEKRHYLRITRSKEEMELMAKLKAIMDPKGILNPGKVL